MKLSSLLPTYAALAILLTRSNAEVVMPGYNNNSVADTTTSDANQLTSIPNLMSSLISEESLTDFITTKDATTEATTSATTEDTTSSTSDDKTVVPTTTAAGEDTATSNDAAVTTVTTDAGTEPAPTTQATPETTEQAADVTTTDEATPAANTDTDGQNSTETDANTTTETPAETSINTTGKTATPEVDTYTTDTDNTNTNTAPATTVSKDTNTVPAPTNTATDTATLPTTTNTVPTDTATVPTDTNTAPTDTNTVPTDTATLPTNTNTAPTDTNTIPTDTNTVPTNTDTPVTPTDSSSVPTDTNTVPSNTDTSVTPTVSSVAPTDTSSVPTDTATVPTDTSSANVTTDSAPAQTTPTETPINTNTNTTPAADTTTPTSAPETTQAVSPATEPTTTADANTYTTGISEPATAGTTAGGITGKPKTTAAPAVSPTTTLPATTDDGGADTPAPTTTKKTSSGWLPDVMVTASGAEESSTSAPIPTTALPKAISPATTGVTAPSGYQLITIGFKQSLNYVFVVEHSISSAQIFEYLPAVLEYPFSDNKASKVVVKQLLPYTSSQLSYIITVAEVYFPQKYINDLQTLLTDSSSKVYNNPNSADRTLAKLIDSRIPITGLLGSSSTSIWVSGGDSGSSSGSSNPDVKPQSLGSMDFSAEASSSVGKSQVSGGHVAGVVSGCSIGVAAYMGVMVALYLRRRNKRIQQDRESASFLDFGWSVGGGRSLGNTHSYASYSGTSLGDIHLDGSNSTLSGSSNSGARSIQPPAPAQKPEMGQKAYMPNISPPIPLKNSLGW